MHEPTGLGTEIRYGVTANIAAFHNYGDARQLGVRFPVSETGWMFCCSFFAVWRWALPGLGARALLPTCSGLRALALVMIHKHQKL